MSITVRLKKGLDIRLKGKAEKKLFPESPAAFYGVKPIDFPLLIPKLNVKTGDRVLAGSPLFHSKLRPEILFTSPVSGIVSEIRRGERRSLLEVVVEREGTEHIDFGRRNAASLSRREIVESLLISGLWPSIRQRPYHIIANPSDTPKSVFISGFDSSPLAPDMNFVMDNTSSVLFQAGIAAIGKLTDGKINLVLNGNSETSELLRRVSGVEHHHFSGPHPAGNIGVQVHHIDPLNKGEIIWFVNLQDVVAIGRLFEEGVYKPERIVAVTGSEVLAPAYHTVRSGASVKALLDNNTGEGDKRYISGNVLTGTRIDYDGFLGYYDSQLTVIPEGKYFEFFGWMMPGFGKFSFSKAFASGFIPGKEYSLDTNYHGGERAFVMTGQYEKVVPMDIYPMQLLKAILAEDIDLMENLGIYEVAEEDLALCEYICSSKIDIQAIVRKGLNLMVKEMN
ncbi:MAG: Na(+)-translocating NADH-quinone reductase subunit A [Bacteroidales bacterium]|jgi:Na+-transporting NADH:ubiquinone oxidoreductase subunit A|nr:Na(+)-translocating NADH-quinone reductase subunit A [Bacteroidales bacterium]MCU0408824.1 Na(+)-translocating NADH-quinone reductase subunit A [Bacteroidales bacterium]